MKLGERMPDVMLFDVMTQKQWALSQIAEDGRPVLIAFMCNHCPYVKHIEEAFATMMKEYADKISIAAISSNDVSFVPEDSPDHLKAQAERLQFGFPYFYDDRQQAAKEFQAASTPEFFLFDDQHTLAYHGQFDNTRPDGDTPTGSDLRNAIEALLNGQPVSSDQSPAIGCSIKWKPGNEPAYA